MRHAIDTVLTALLLTASVRAADDDTKVSARDGMAQVLVPAGDFVMGADEDDAFGRKAESPPHRVHLDAFWIDRFEVANAQFAAFLNSAAKGDRPTIYRYCDPDTADCRITVDGASGVCRVEEGFERHPVCAVSWHGAAAYARHVRRRLPTEAEWEKAARGTDQRRYPWGSDWRPQRTNTREAGTGRLLPVGTAAADRSPYGAHDMAGNVREWVEDEWDEAFYSASPLRNPLKEGPRRRVVVRGGAWCLTEWDARSTSRQPLIPSSRRRYMGFRCAQTVPKPLPEPVPVSQDVLFYAPFDGSVHAAAARGSRRPLKATKDIRFAPGKRGQAALLGADTHRHWVDYGTEGNIRLAEGTVAFWIQPQGWSGTDKGFRYFFMLRDVTCCKFYVYRFIEKNLLVLAGNGVEGQWGSISTGTQAWQDGQWIHLAVTWNADRAVTLYVDGTRAGRTVVPAEKYIRGLPGHFSLGQSQDWDQSRYPAQTCLDEFVIFSRALTPEEVMAEANRTGLP